LRFGLVLAKLCTKKGKNSMPWQPKKPPPKIVHGVAGKGRKTSSVQLQKAQARDDMVASAA